MKELKFRAWDKKNLSWILCAWWSIDTSGNGDELLEDFEIVGNIYENPDLLNKCNSD